MLIETPHGRAELQLMWIDHTVLATVWSSLPGAIYLTPEGITVRLRRRQRLLAFFNAIPGHQEMHQFYFSAETIPRG